MRSSLTEELSEVRNDLEAKLAVKDEERRAALEAQCVELSGSAEAVPALRAQQEKEARN